MKLVQAHEEDSEALKIFFNRQVLKGHFDYRLERPNSFFDQYKLLTNNYKTFLLKDREQKIHAMASIIFRKGYFNHQEQSIAYVTDLRVDSTRQATLQWASKFMPALKQQVKENDCRYVFSALEQYESKAYNTLLRRRNRSSELPRYHLFRKFFVVAILGRRFFRDDPIPSIQINRADEDDIESIAKYLREKSVAKPLYYNLTDEELLRRLKEWPDFSIHNFRIARNKRGDIIGCMAPWNNKQVQKWIPHRYHGKSFQNYSTAAPLWKLRLIKRLPRENEAFDLKFLTHCACDNPDIFYSLLDRCYEESEPSEIITYSNFIGDYQTRPPKSFVTLKIPYGFYSLMGPNETLPAFLQPNPFQPPPDFQYTHF